MRIKQIVIALLIGFLTCYSLNAQLRVKDSVEIYDLPVKKGVVYEYDYGTRYVCRNPGITIVTKEDSLFNFEDGLVTGISPIDKEQDLYIVVVKNFQDNYICYFNLKPIGIKKNDKVKTGDFIGLLGQGNEACNEVGIMIIQKNLQNLSEKKVIELIKSSTCSNDQTYTL